MSVTPNDLLILATQLLDSPDGKIEEATLRCSASRAYYAALHAADLSLPQDIAVTASDKRGRSSHQAVIDAFVLWSKSIRPGRTEAISVARSLPRLRSARKNADYNLDEEFSAEDAKDAVRIATATIESALRAKNISVEKQA